MQILSTFSLNFIRDHDSTQIYVYKYIQFIQWLVFIGENCTVDDMILRNVNRA